MAKQNWSDIGNIISDAVQDAIDTEDFSKLSQSIQTIVGSAVSSAVSSAADSVTRGINSAGNALKQTAESMTKQQKAKPAAQNPWKGNGQFEKKTADHMLARDIPQNELYSGGGSTRAGGYALSALGGLGCFGFGLGILIPLIVSGVTRESVMLPVAVQIPFLLLSALCLWKGTSLLGRIRRFKNYVRALGTRTCISIQELASSVNRGEAATLKDVRRMISLGMFRQGHLDLNGKNLFVTNQGYEAYLQDHQRMEEKKVEQIAQQKARTAYKDNSALSDEVKKMIAEGQDYIDKIHAANEAIKDEVVSQKLDGLEAVSTKIFQYVEQHPESASETKKLMKYYLPTTIKLLESYQKLSAQPVQGPNIFKSKKEIEDTLDTLNQAFARLFDNLYQDTSMDITSDISVLNTLLAQEGLTGERLNENA